jgi:DNA-binding transcriptional ArsR family regulator
MKEFCNEAYYLIFSTLANRTRLAIIDALKDGRKSISDISTALEQEENRIAHNLKPLEQCAVVLSEGSGKKKLYSLNREIIEPLSEILAFHVDKYCPEFKDAYLQKNLGSI